MHVMTGCLLRDDRPSILQGRTMGRECEFECCCCPPQGNTKPLLLLLPGCGARGELGPRHNEALA